MNKIRTLLVLSGGIFIGLFLLFSCGGGGGGGGLTPNVPYTGINTPAIITDENAVNLATGAYLGLESSEEAGDVIILSSDGSSGDQPVGPLGITLLDSKILEKTFYTHLNTNSQDGIIPLSSVKDSIPGLCDGYADVNGKVENNGSFNLTFTYYDFSDDCAVYVTGRANMKGKIDVDYNFIYMTATFEAMTFAQDGESITQGGRMSIDYREYPYKETMDMVSLDNSTGKTYWMKDYVLYVTTDSDGSSNYDLLQGTGSYYDSDYGYVDVTMTEAIKIYWDDPWPIAGELKAVGAASTSALLSCIHMGTYTVDLDTDGDENYDWNSGYLHWSGTNTPPVAEAGTDRTTQVGNPVTLDGSASADADGDILSFDWSILEKPASSGITLSVSDTVTPVFTPDVLGTYRFGLTVNDGFENSSVDTVTIYVTPAPTMLSYRVTDAEYSRQLDRIIMVSSAPNSLHIYNPATDTENTVSLPLTPSCVSVGPDGLFAAVGHDAWVSYVNLSTGTLIKTIAVSTDVLDVVLAGNGYIYAFPRTDQWERIRCLNISSEAESLHTGNYIYAGTRAKLHPGGLSIYGADNGLSPSDIEKYDISSGTAQYLHDSPYHGDYSMGGNLWMSDDGLRIFTRAGNVFRASDGPDDMTYNGSLSDVSTVESLDHSSLAGKVIVIPEEPFFSGPVDDTELQIYDYDFLVYESTVPLPDISVGDSNYAGHGRFVFFDSTGGQYFVILQADESSGILNDFGVVTY